MFTKTNENCRENFLLNIKLREILTNYFLMIKNEKQIKCE